MLPPSAFHPEDGASMGLRNVAILPQQYIALQLIRPRPVTSKGSLIGRSFAKWPTGRPRTRLEDNIKMGLTETHYDVKKWIELAKD
jgi:hypothetical protein